MEKRIGPDGQPTYYVTRRELEEAQRRATNMNMTSVQDETGAWRVIQGQVRPDQQIPVNPRSTGQQGTAEFVEGIQGLEDTAIRTAGGLGGSVAGFAAGGPPGAYAGFVAGGTLADTAVAAKQVAQGRAYRRDEQGNTVPIGPGFSEAAKYVGKGAGIGLVRNSLTAGAGAAVTRVAPALAAALPRSAQAPVQFMLPEVAENVTYEVADATLNQRPISLAEMLMELPVTVAGGIGARNVGGPLSPGAELAVGRRLQGNPVPDPAPGAGGIAPTSSSPPLGSYLGAPPSAADLEFELGQALQAPRLNPAAALDPSLIQPAPPPDINTILPNATPATPGQTLRELATGEQSFARRQGKGVDTPERPSVRARVRERVQATPEPEALPEPPAQVEAPDVKAAINSDIVRAALEDTGGYANEAVNIADIRRALGDTYAREDVDAALKEMQAAGDLALYNKEDPLSVTQADRDSALILGGDSRHLVYLKDSIGEKYGLDIKQPANAGEQIRGVKAAREGRDLGKKGAQPLPREAPATIANEPVVDTPEVAPVAASAASEGKTPRVAPDADIADEIQRIEEMLPPQGRNVVPKEERPDLNARQRQDLARQEYISSLGETERAALERLPALRASLKSQKDLAIGKARAKSKKAWPGNKKTADRFESGLKESGVPYSREDAAGGSVYFDIDGLQVRIADHEAPPGGGFSQELQRRMGEADIDVNPYSNLDWQSALQRVTGRPPLHDLPETSAKQPRVTPAIRKARLALRSAQSALEYRVSRDMETSYFEDLVATREAELDGLLEKKYPGLAPEARIEFIETGKLDASKRVAPEEDIANLDADDPTDDIMRTIKDAFFDERGASLRFGKAASEGIKKSVSRAAERYSENKALLDYVRKRDELGRRIVASQGKERVKIESELRKLNDEYQSRSGVTDKEVKAAIADMNSKREAFISDIDTSELDVLGRPELAAEAKKRGMKVKGSNADLARAIATEDRRREFATLPAANRQEAQVHMDQVLGGIEADAKQSSLRGTVGATIDALDRWLIDSRGPAKRKLQNAAGQRGKDVGDALTATNHTDPMTQMQWVAFRDIFIGNTDLDSGATAGIARRLGNEWRARKRLTAQQMFGKDIPASESGFKQSREDWMSDLMVAMSTKELAEQRPELLQPHGITPAALDTFISAVRSSPAGEEMYQRAGVLFKMIHDATIGAARAEGLITKEQYEALAKRQHYIPRRFNAEDSSATLLDNLYAAPEIDKGARLTTGSVRSLYKDVPALFQNMAAETNRQIAHNRANRALYDLVTEAPGVAEALNIKVVEQKGAFKPAPSGTTATAMIDGKAHTMSLGDSNFAKAWNKSSPILNSRVARALQLFSGVAAVKATATGVLAPYFALRNLPRDFAMTIALSPEYSALQPLAALQLGRDLAVVAKDAASGPKRARGRLRAYFEEAGGGETLAYDANQMFPRWGKKTQTITDIAHALNGLNQFSENWIRLAHRERAIRNGATPEQASAIARDRINFSQGGLAIKAFDNIIPYLGAATQGTRAIGRAASNNPVRTSAAMSQWVALGAMLYYLWNGQEGVDEEYSKLSANERGHNFAITIPGMGRTDPKTGIKEPLFMRIAKDDSIKLAVWTGEQIARMAQGKRPDMETLDDLFRDLVLFGDVDSFVPPIADFAVAYNWNYDSFKQRNIWTGGDVSRERPLLPDDNSAEVNEDTPQFFVDTIGALGGSPARGSAAFGTMVNSANPIFPGLGGFYEILRGVGKDGSPEALEKAKQTQRDVLLNALGGVVRYGTHDATLSEMTQDEARKENLRALNRRQLTKKIVEDVRTKQDLRELAGAIKEATNSLPVNERDKFLSSVINSGMMKTHAPMVQQKARSIFINTQGKGAVQAVEYYNQILTGTKAEKEAVQKAAALAGNEDFYFYFWKLTGQDTPESKARYEAFNEAKRTGKQLPGVNRDKLRREISPEPE